MCRSAAFSSRHATELGPGWDATSRPPEPLGAAPQHLARAVASRRRHELRADGIGDELGQEAIDRREGPPYRILRRVVELGKLRLRGKGVPEMKGTGRGDLYVVPMIHVPTDGANERVPEAVNVIESSYARNPRADLRL